MGLFGGMKVRGNEGGPVSGLTVAAPMAPPDGPRPANGPAAPGPITTPREAARAWQSLDADGQAAFERWLNDYRAEAAARHASPEPAEP